MPVIPANLAVLPRPGMLIGDKRTYEAALSCEHRYAANGELTCIVPLAASADVDAAVSAARAALPGWRSMPANQRRRLMLDFAQMIRSHAEELGQLATVENGTVRMQGMMLPHLTAEFFDYNAGWTDKIGGEVVTTWPGEALDYTLEEPYGVIGIIVPWNGPIVSFGQVVAPAIAAGNCTVIKPPELAPFSCLRLAELALEAGIPAGVINVVPAGPEGGEALSRHPGIDKLHFTGSGATARKVLAGAIENLTPVGLELGGKSARLVFADADRTSAVRNAIFPAVSNSGQACIAGSRVLIEASIYDSFVADCQQALEAVAIGDPALPKTMMGPVINEAACERILAMVRKAEEAGGTVVTGGQRLGGELAGGYFIGPTMIANVDNDAAIARHEVFGPVISMISFKDEDDAVRIANDSPFALAAYVESGDVRRVHRLAPALESGLVAVNGMFSMCPSAPFGGNKQSGTGRIGGSAGLHEFMRPKNVYLKL